MKNICELSGERLVKAMQEAKEGTYSIENMDRSRAESLVDQLKKVGTIAIITEEVDEV